MRCVDGGDVGSGCAAGSGAIILLAEDLPAYCPNAKMPLWSWHPRVFLDVVNEAQAMCPYCGSRYRLDIGTQVHDEGFGALNLHQDHKQTID